MGCFLGCFGKKKKDRKRRKPANKVLPREQRHVSYEPLESNVSPKQQEEITENPISPVLEKSEKIEEQLSLSTRKRVTFDLNVKAYEEVCTHEITESDNEEEEKGKREDKISRSTSLSEDDSNTSSLGSFPSNHRYGNCRNSDDECEEMESDEDIDLDDEDDDDYDDDDEEEEEERRLGDVESSESFFSLPMETRTRSFGTSVAEKEVNSPLKVSGSLDEETQPLQSNRNARDRSQYVHSVLNPVENLTQWKAVKAKTSSPSPLKTQKKENINLEQEPNIPFSPEPTFKLSLFSFNSNSLQSTSPPSKQEQAEPTLKLSSFSFNSNSHQSTSPPSKQEQAEPTLKLSSFSFNSNSHQSTSPPSKQELAVDTSLSNWLGSSETTPSTKTSNLSVGNNRIESGEVVNKFQRSNSPRSHEDRPILGALTLEEIKQFSATSSPRRSPRHSPDDKPILGTVGSYWSHTDQSMESSSGSSCKGIPNTTSKYREDKRVNWHSTPFETRLERALNKGAAEAYTSY